MDNVDNCRKAVHIEGLSRVGLDVRLNPLSATSFLCGKNRENLSTDYPQKNDFLIKSTSWRFIKSTPIYGGIGKGKFRVQPGLLHSKGYLSTDYRELSTNLGVGKPVWGISLPPKYRRCFIQKNQIWVSADT